MKSKLNKFRISIQNLIKNNNNKNQLKLINKINRKCNNYNKRINRKKTFSN